MSDFVFSLLVTKKSLLMQLGSSSLGNVLWSPPQDLVEKVVVLRRAVEQTQRCGPTAIGILLAEKMSQYANLLASQGSLSTAITYLPDNTNQVRNASGPGRWS